MSENLLEKLLDCVVCIVLYSNAEKVNSNFFLKGVLYQRLNVLKNRERGLSKTHTCVCTRLFTYEYKETIGVKIDF